MGREWVANVLQALCGNEFENFVRTKEAAHRNKVARQRNLNVSSKHFTIALDPDSPYICGEAGYHPPGVHPEGQDLELGSARV